MHRHQRPIASKEIGDRIKLHRRVVRLDDKDHTVVTLRPGTRVRYATNHFHGTWHILSDLHGAKLLGRLLWGLSYQRRPGTIVVIEPAFLDPNPFDAERSDPIVLIPQQLSHLNGSALRDLRRQLPLRTPSSGTVRWQTHGLESYEFPVHPEEEGTIDRRQGLLVLAGTAPTLRRWASQTWELGEYWYKGMAYDYLQGTCPIPDGEIQIFNDYHRRVSAARVARREVLAEQDDPAPPDDLNPVIWARGTLVRERRGYL